MKLSDRETYTSHRAWIELNMDYLDHNVECLYGILPQECELIAVLKANACGHGDVLMARELNRVGIHSFAVATLREAIRMRENGISGDILILGYTHPDDIPLLHQYGLTQTLVDADYAQLLEQYGQKLDRHQRRTGQDSGKWNSGGNARLRVNVKIDTGLHRIGVDYRDLEELKRIYRMRHLNITGTFTQLSAPDSCESEDMEFTCMQVEAFRRAVSCLRQEGFQTGKLHVQSSYGIINYPEFCFDAARSGMALYGAMTSEDIFPGHDAGLLPVMSLKARVAMVKELPAGESVSYGHKFTAGKTMKTATLTIGYGDGIPRSLSCGQGSVLIRGRRAQILGSLCMDQMIVDVTGIEGVCSGDEAVLIGRSGNLEIRAEDMARQAGMIVPELLSGLTSRVERTAFQAAEEAVGKKEAL